MSQVVVRQARWPDDLTPVRRLLHCYFHEFMADLGNQDFHGEIAQLDAKYDGKTQTMWVAELDGHVVGIAGLRVIDNATGELKRMVVDPAVRGQGVGRALGLHVLAEARKRRLTSVLLDTVKSMQVARKLYDSLGFKERGPYYGSPLCGAVFMEARLA